MRTVTVAEVPAAAADEMAQTSGSNAAMTMAENATETRRDMSMSHPFPRGLVGLWSEVGPLAPGPTCRAFPIRRAADQWLRFRAAAGIPGHSGGGPPGLHRLPLPPPPLFFKPP